MSPLPAHELDGRVHIHLRVPSACSALHSVLWRHHKRVRHGPCHKALEIQLGKMSTQSCELPLTPEITDKRQFDFSAAPGRNC